MFAFWQFSAATEFMSCSAIWKLLKYRQNQMRTSSKKIYTNYDEMIWQWPFIPEASSTTTIRMTKDKEQEWERHKFEAHVIKNKFSIISLGMLCPILELIWSWLKSKHQFHRFDCTFKNYGALFLFIDHFIVFTFYTLIRLYLVFK